MPGGCLWSGALSGSGEFRRLPASEVSIPKFAWVPGGSSKVRQSGWGNAGRADTQRYEKVRKAVKYISRFNALLASRVQEGISVFRIVTAFQLLQHGTQSLFMLPIPAHSGKPAHFPSLDWLAGSMEFWLGMLFLIGLFTQPLAFLFCGLTAVAYFMVHAPRGFWPLANGGEPAVLFCFSFLFFATAGGGSWSVDRYLSRRQAPERR